MIQSLQPPLSLWLVRTFEVSSLISKQRRTASGTPLP
jgi:hypothetical protein